MRAPRLSLRIDEPAPRYYSPRSLSINHSDHRRGEDAVGWPLRAKTLASAPNSIPCFPVHTAGFYNCDVPRKAKPTTRIPRAFWIAAALCFVALLFAILFSVYYSGGRVGFQ